MSVEKIDIPESNIVLTKEQDACVKYVGEKTLMVKGFAGAGKSVVLMSIAQKYAEKYKGSTGTKVGVFTYQNTLVSTMKELLELNGGESDSIYVSTVNSYVKSIYEWFVEQGIAPKRKFPYTKDKKQTYRKQNIEEIMKRHQEKYGHHRFHDLSTDFWLEEFDWMKDMDVWRDERDYYLTLSRKGRGADVRMSPADRVVAFQLFSYYCDYLEETKQADWSDQTLFVVRNGDKIPDDMKFDHVLIDEAQDLSLAQMKAIMMIYREDMVVAMDANQRIHGKNWTAKQLGIETTTKKLTQSMRTTKQIDALAESVRNKNDEYMVADDLVSRAIPVRDGEIPQVVELEDKPAEKKYIQELAKEYMKVNPEITIGIIVSKNDQLEVISEWMAEENIKHEIVKRDHTFSAKSPGVKLVTSFGAKGLEFNLVIIPGFEEGNFPYSAIFKDEEKEEEFMVKMRNIAYVSMTRAKNVLIITYCRNKRKSRFIGEMDPELYKEVGFEKKQDNKTDVDMPPVVKPDSDPSKDTDLAGYFKGKGLEVIDKRYNNGCLWVVGTKAELDSYVREVGKAFGAFGQYSTKGGYATRHRPAWFTRCKK